MLAMALVATTVLAGAPDVRAATLYVAAYGGSFEDVMRNQVFPPFEKKYGVTVEFVAGYSTDNLAKLQAQKGSEQIDVAILDDGPMYHAVQLGFCALRAQAPLTSSSLLSAGKYIHGDFDLYGIVPAVDPSKNVAVSELRLGRHHSRSPEFFDVQNYINSRIGVPMVLHGAQESYGAEHSDEGIDLFCPDGKMIGAENAAEIGMLYEKQFKGRKLFTHDGPREVVRGMFMTPA